MYNLLQDHNHKEELFKCCKMLDEVVANLNGAQEIYLSNGFVVFDSNEIQLVVVKAHRLKDLILSGADLNVIASYASQLRTIIDAVAMPAPTMSRQ